MPGMCFPGASFTVPGPGLAPKQCVMSKVRPTIKIDFCDFWPHFCKTDNFFYHILSKHYNLVLHDYPDFIIYSMVNNPFHKLHNCVRIYYGVESFLPDWSVCDYAFTSHYLDDDPRHLRLPLYAFWDDPKVLVKEDGEAERVMAHKTKFCSWLASNHSRKTRVRTNFFHRLSRYKPVDSGGRFANNVGYVVPQGPYGKRDFIKPHKFNMAFENISLVGYTTEKIFEAMQMRCIPIYWGSSRVNEEFNPKSFLNYFDFPNEEALIQRIIELDRNEDQYLAVLREPYYHHNRPNIYCSEERFLEQFEKIFSTKIKPAAQRRKFFQLGRWMLVKRNKLLPND